MRNNSINSLLSGISLFLLIGIAGFIFIFYQSDFREIPAQVNSSESQLSKICGNQAIRFERNDGQTDEQADFFARGKNFNLFLSSDGAALRMQDAEGREQVTMEKCRRETPQSIRLLHMRLVEANSLAKGYGLDELVTRSNYFIGNDREKWVTDVPNYAKVQYTNVYPDIDLRYYGNQGKLEFDFIVAPHADPGVIVLKLDGAKDQRLDEKGNLILTTDCGELIMQAPIAYQEKSGIRETIPAKYLFRRNEYIAFEIGAYDESNTLIIDPVLVYSTFLGIGGTGEDVEADADGFVYIVGSDGTDAFVTKFHHDSSSLIYTTYLGGQLDDFGKGIAMDATGNVYITGETQSDDFPVQNAIQENFGGALWLDGDAFICKLDPDGKIVYSTYLGGDSEDIGYDIAVDPSGNAYVTGKTISWDFPVENAYQQSIKTVDIYTWGSDAFITKISTDGSEFIFSTYLGGGLHDNGSGIALDNDNNIYITGTTGSTDFPTTDGAYNTKGTSAFVTKMNAQGTDLVYSTCLSSTSTDPTISHNVKGLDIAVDDASNAVIFGLTSSPAFPTVKAIQPSLGGERDNFVAKFNTDGSSLIFSTYLGGSDYEGDYNDFGGITLDSEGNVFITGATESADFPTKEPLQSNLRGLIDVFITEIAADGLSMPFSTYLGGNNWDRGYGIAADISDNIYIVGWTISEDFPLEAAMIQGLPGSDCFLVKLATAEKGVLAVSHDQIMFPQTQVGESSTVTVELASVGPDSLKILAIDVEPTTIFSIENKPGLPLSLASGKKIQIQVLYTPQSFMAVQKSKSMNSSDAGALTILTKDTDEPIKSIPLKISTDIVVNDAGDRPDANLDDEVCDVDLDKPGNQCTLRAAIENVNYFQDQNATKVYIRIPGEGGAEIHPNSSLPPIEYPIYFDMESSDHPLLLNGSDAGQTDGLEIRSGYCFLQYFIIYNWKGNGIKINGGESNTIQDCTVKLNAIGKGNPVAGILIEGSSSNNLRNNYIFSNDEYGVFINGESSRNNVIEECTFGYDNNDRPKNKIGTGIYIKDGSDNKIRHNKIGNTHSCGIYVSDATRSIIEHNQVIDGEIDGITISETALETEIRYNHIGCDEEGLNPSPNTCGIRIVKEAAQTHIHDNLISGNKKAGIYMVSSTGLISGTLIEKNIIGLDHSGTSSLRNGSGITLSGLCKSTTIRKNTISGNTFNGIRINNLGRKLTEIYDNYIGTDTTGTLPNPNYLYGISISNSSSVIIAGNVVSCNFHGQIDLSDDEVDRTIIRDNNIGTNKYGAAMTGFDLSSIAYGIGCKNATADISDNLIAYQPYGIYCSSGSKGYISDNFIHNNDLGLKIEASSVEVFMNEIYQNGDGLEIDDTKQHEVIVAANHIYDNTAMSTGIHLKNTNATIIGNTIHRDAGHGIAVDGSSSPFIKKNNILDNAGFGLNNMELAESIYAQDNWWGDASGPGGSGPGTGDEVSDGVDFSNWRTEMVSVFVAAENDTIFLPTGETDSTLVFFQNWANLDDNLTINISEELGWMQTPLSFSTPLADSLGAVESIVFTIPEGIPDGTQNHIQVTATSQSDPDAVDTTSFVVLSAQAVMMAISIIPDSVAIAPGDTIFFTATGFDQFYQPFAFTPGWSCTGGVIDTGGLYIAGNDAGAFEVTVTDEVSGISGKAQIIITPVVSVSEVTGEIPSVFQLYQNFPNPFNITTTIRFDLHETSDVKITIFNILGQQVTVLTGQKYTAGQHQIKWDGHDQAGRILARGIYIYCIQANNGIQSRQMLFLP